jgi:hypothetical protein
MFQLFKRTKKASPTVEEQIQVLRDLGFTFNLNDAGELIDCLLEQFEREGYEEDPYFLLLTVAGAELYDGNRQVIRMCDDVWNFDMECMEEEDAYTRLLRNFIDLAKGELPLEHIESNIDFDREEAVVSFHLDGNSYQWRLTFEYDWADIDLFKKLGKLAAERNKGKQYIYFNDGQSLTLMYCDKQTWQRLNELSKKKFIKLA